MRPGRGGNRVRLTNERLRIALVIGTLGLGGAETQLCRLAIELKSKGHVVKVFAIMDGGPLVDELVGNGVDFEIFYFRGFVYRDEVRGLVPGDLARSFRCVWQFWRSMWSFSPDVCEAYLLWAYILAIPGAALARVPVRISARRGLSSTVRLQRRVRAMRTIANSVTTVVVANSTLVAEDIRGVELCLPRRIEVIPNGIDIPSEVADVTSVPAKGLMVANLIEYKGHEDLLRALSLMRSPPEVTCIGGGPEKKRLEYLATELGLNDIVCFVGRLPNAGQEFAKYQFAILASHEEGMPNAVLEAMSYGVPVVATSVGGVPEISRGFSDRSASARPRSRRSRCGDRIDCGRDAPI